ncbi:MAG: hypothetical protein CMP47_09510 [Rickettsiales bacterium]|nr:hypothetical protein [Rickettsiales bacterium]
MLRTLGATSMVEHIIDLRDLGLNDYPRISSGKPRKNELCTIIKEHFASRGSSLLEPHIDPQHTFSLPDFCALWQKLLHVEPGMSLTPASSVFEFADSLLLSRLPKLLKEERGLTLGLHDVVRNSVIKDQLTLLSTTTRVGQAVLPPTGAQRAGQPGVEDMKFVQGDANFAKQAQQAIQNILSPLNLSWDNNVEDVIPVYSLMELWLRQRRQLSGYMRSEWLCAASVQDVSRALRLALTEHAILQSMAAYVPGVALPAHEHQAVFVVMRPTDSWFDETIVLRDEVVEKTGDLMQLFMDDLTIDFVSRPGPLCALCCSK